MKEIQNKHLKKPHIPRYFGKLALFVFVMIASIIGVKFVSSKSYAAGTQVNVKVNYIDEMITVTTGAGQSTKFYVSKNGMKSWDLMDGGVLDLSTILTSKEVSLHFKGNKDPEPIEFRLQGLSTSLVAEYKVLNGEGYALVTGTSQTVEYKKSKDGSWKTLGVNMIPTAPYELYGTTLYFRTVATEYNRAGKIVTLKIPKKGTAPGVKLDGGKLTITGLKEGQTQYRVGDSTNWIDFVPTDSKNKVLNVKTLLAPTLANNAPIPAGIIEFRTKATDKKPASAVKVLEIPAQAAAPENVQLIGTTLTAYDNDLKRAYEYTIVKSSMNFDISTAKWTSFTAAKPVLIKGVTLGDTILVRVKTTTDKTTKNVILASAYKSFLVTSISSY